jgi:hypothetical protein
MSLRFVDRAPASAPDHELRVGVAARGGFGRMAHLPAPEA